MGTQATLIGADCRNWRYVSPDQNEIVFFLGESLITHRNQVKLLNAIVASAAAVVACCIGSQLPAKASIQVWLNKGTIVFKNDGIPTFGAGQGCIMYP